MLNYMSWTNTLCVAIALIALVLNFILAFNLRLGMQRKTQFTRYSAMLFGCVFLFACANLAENLLDGVPGDEIRVPLFAACFCDFLFSGLLAFTGSGFLLTFADPKRELIVLRKVLLGLLVLHVAALILAQSFGFFFTIDAANRYHREAWYPLSLLPPALMLLLDVYILLFCNRNLDRNDRYVFGAFVAVPAVGVILQVHFIGVMPITVMLTSVLLHLFLTQKQLADFYAEQEENLRLRTEILLSQIQPHFLYNTLGAIADLCDTEPSKAKKTILRFSHYLHGVLETTDRRQPVPFAQELEQTKLYLELAKVRFEDALQVEYRIECTDFLLPSMCLQPLVENAVRHGVRKNREGRGTVTITSVEREDCYEVSVMDDGPGIDRQKQPDRERIHVGVSNVRERLRLMCGGSLELAEAAGRGTTATIRIPKE